MIKTTRFDAADYLDSEEMIAEYLKAAIDDADPELFISAIGDVIKARGMEQIAKSVGMSRKDLREAMRSDTGERAIAIQKVLAALGIDATTPAADAAE